MTTRPFLTAAEVAQLLGLPDAPAFLRRRADLEGAAGFPPPMPWTIGRRRMAWRADQVQAWVDRQGTPGARDLPAPAADPFTATRLERRARAC
jgi:predicted DNA-binding transcriptional regulator AlpA